MNEQIAMRVSKVSIIVNVLLSAGKLLAGIVGHSSAMVSDAIHSASDVFSTVIVIIGVKISGRASDHDHQYGHERMECVAAMILAMVLALTGLSIGKSGITTILDHSYTNLQMPSKIALFAALASIITKEGMYWYTIINAKKINSSALKADAWHHRSDALSSIGAFLGILASRMGYPIFDPVASLVICLCILKASYDIFKDAVDKMVDKACDDKTIENMIHVINQEKGVKRVDLVKTRLFGSKIYVDVEIAADGNILLKDAHNIAENVHHSIENNFKDVKHCHVHVNPY